ncbi:2-keto-4-pentenoate hydratase [Rhodopila sp.]|uniref:2-keto-4-pentenoate hydratase n=1 Tax=Rhodopila sp. TaxID=2480087 RepID=UPI002C6682DE|nr:fumarylacetoacetate hydrolase family protein [Rhodopila sp.]HVZ10606.1 fumarylacetoacetate hydrolase family protein [Rhodopila sp.]
MIFNEADAVEAFWRARLRGDFAPAAYYDHLTIDDAHRVQLGLIARRVRMGERQLGWKVGLTAKAIQQQFGFHEPVFGCVLQTTESGHVFPPHSLIKPGFECVLCMRLDRDLPAGSDLAAARAAVGQVHPALEIIETRVPMTQIPCAMADNAQQKTCVLGAPVALPEAPEKVACTVEINGEVAGGGTGDAVLGNPLNALVWLAGKLASHGRALRAGDIVMTGSFTRQFPIAPGDRIRVTFTGVGVVEASMAS